MQPSQSLLFTIPMGLGSIYTFCASKWKGDEVSYFTYNDSYYMEMFVLWLICTIYFCWDLCLIIRKCFTDSSYRKEANTPLFVIHHVIGIISCYLVVTSAQHLIKFYIAYMTYELTNPFLNVITRAHKNKIENLFVTGSQIIFSILFTIVRIMFGSWITWELIREFYKLEGMGKILILLPFTLQVINYWWYYRIVRLWLKKFGYIKSNSLVKVKIDEITPDIEEEDLKYDNLRGEVKEEVNGESCEHPDKENVESAETDQGMSVNLTDE